MPKLHEQPTSNLLLVEMINTPNKLILHCSDTPNTLDIGAKEIRDWHTAKPPRGNGWSDIGYHYVIRRNGLLEYGRPEHKVGAHCRGHNQDSIGICFVGRDEFKDVQYKTFIKLFDYYYTNHQVLPLDVFGHYEFDSRKDCPNIMMDEFRLMLEASVISKS